MRDSLVSLQAQGLPLGPGAGVLGNLEQLISGMADLARRPQVVREIRELELTVRHSVARQLLNSSDEALRVSLRVPTGTLNDFSPDLRLDADGLLAGAGQLIPGAESFTELQRYLRVYGGANFNLREELEKHGPELLGALPQPLADRVRILCQRALRIVHFGRFRDIPSSEVRDQWLLGEPDIAALRTFESWIPETVSAEIVVNQDLEGALCVFEAVERRLGAATDHAELAQALEDVPQLRFVGKDANQRLIPKEELMDALRNHRPVPATILAGLDPRLAPVIEPQRQELEPKDARDLARLRSQTESLEARLLHADFRQASDDQVARVRYLLDDAMGEQILALRQKAGEGPEVLAAEIDRLAERRRDLFAAEVAVRAAVSAVQNEGGKISEARTVWDEKFDLACDTAAEKFVDTVMSNPCVRMHGIVTLRLNRVDGMVFRRVRGDQRTRDMKGSNVRVQPGDQLEIVEEATGEVKETLLIQFEEAQRTFRVSSTTKEAPRAEPAKTADASQEDGAPVPQEATPLEQWRARFGLLTPRLAALHGLWERSEALKSKVRAVQDLRDVICGRAAVVGLKTEVGAVLQQFPEDASELVLASRMRMQAVVAEGGEVEVVFDQARQVIQKYNELKRTLSSLYGPARLGLTAGKLRDLLTQVATVYGDGTMPTSWGNALPDNAEDPFTFDEWLSRIAGTDEELAPLKAWLDVVESADLAPLDSNMTALGGAGGEIAAFNSRAGALKTELDGIKGRLTELPPQAYEASDADARGFRRAFKDPLATLYPSGVDAAVTSAWSRLHKNVPALAASFTPQTWLADAAGQDRLLTETRERIRSRARVAADFQAQALADLATIETSFQRSYAEPSVAQEDQFKQTYDTDLKSLYGRGREADLIELRASDGTPSIRPSILRGAWARLHHNFPELRTTLTPTSWQGADQSGQMRLLDAARKKIKDATRVSEDFKHRAEQDLKIIETAQTPIPRVEDSEVSLLKRSQRDRLKKLFEARRQEKAAEEFAILQKVLPDAYNHAEVGKSLRPERIEVAIDLVAAKLPEQVQVDLVEHLRGRIDRLAGAAMDAAGVALLRSKLDQLGSHTDRVSAALERLEERIQVAETNRGLPDDPHRGDLDRLRREKSKEFFENHKEWKKLTRALSLETHPDNGRPHQQWKLYEAVFKATENIKAYLLENMASFADSRADVTLEEDPPASEELRQGYRFRREGTAGHYTFTREAGAATASFGRLDLGKNYQEVVPDHLQVCFQGGEWQVQSFSTDGTRVNGKKLSTGSFVKINDQDILQLGNAYFQVAIPASGQFQLCEMAEVDAKKILEKKRPISCTGTLGSYVVTIQKASALEGIKLGRSNEVLVDAKTISREHLRLDHDGTRWRVSNLNARNETYVNGVVVAAAPMLLGERPFLSMGECYFRVSFDNPVNIVLTQISKDEVPEDCRRPEDRTPQPRGGNAGSGAAPRAGAAAPRARTATKHTFAFAPQSGKIYWLGKAKHCNAEIPNGDLASEHLSFAWESDHWEIQDMGTDGGTRLNGRDIGQGSGNRGDWLSLESGSIFEVGGIYFEVTVNAANNLQLIEITEVDAKTKIGLKRAQGAGAGSQAGSAAIPAPVMLRGDVDLNNIPVVSREATGQLGSFSIATSQGVGYQAKSGHNEDTAAYVFDPNGDLCLLDIDGMGGHGHGDVASGLITDEFVNHFGRTGDARGAFRKGHEAVDRWNDQNISDRELGNSPGAVGVSAQILKPKADWPAYRVKYHWSGDPEGFHLRREKGGAWKVVYDIEKHERAGQPTQCLGAAERLFKVDSSSEMELEEGDLVLLGSDCLTKIYGDDLALLLPIIRQCQTADEVVRTITQDAHARMRSGGKKDNYSVAAYLHRLKGQASGKGAGTKGAASGGAQAGAPSGSGAARGNGAPSCQQSGKGVEVRLGNAKKIRIEKGASLGVAPTIMGGTREGMYALTIPGLKRGPFGSISPDPNQPGVFKVMATEDGMQIHRRGRHIKTLDAADEMDLQTGDVIVIQGVSIVVS